MKAIRSEFMLGRGCTSLPISSAHYPRLAVSLRPTLCPSFRVIEARGAGSIQMNGPQISHNLRRCPLVGSETIGGWAAEQAVAQSRSPSE